MANRHYIDPEDGEIMTENRKLAKDFNKLPFDVQGPVLLIFCSIGAIIYGLIESGIVLTIGIIALIVGILGAIYPRIGSIISWTILLGIVGAIIYVFI
jgi:hypothetical protein